MPQDGVHTKGQGPWHLCSRCDRKTKLDSELEWQLGLLLCEDCYDNKIFGTYDAEVASIVATIDQNPDLTPSTKLTNPDIESVIDEIWI